MLKLIQSTFTQPGFFCVLVTPSFKKEDDPVSDRMYSIVSQKMHFFAYNHSKFSDGRPQTTFS